MIIRSQNKEVVTNFEKVANIMLSDREENEFEIVVMLGDGIRGMRLGVYSSEEKAIKVLDMIQDKYLNCNRESMAGCFGFVKNTVFQMPQDEEV